MSKKISFNRWLGLVLSIIPRAEVGEDNDGQIVIYTGLKEDGKGGVVDFETEDQEQCGSS